LVPTCGEFNGEFIGEFCGDFSRLFAADIRSFFKREAVNF